MAWFEALKNKLKKEVPEQQSASSSQGSAEMKLIEMISPSTLAQRLKKAEGGDIFEQQSLFNMMEQKDAHLFAELSKRRRALLALDWRLVPPENATDSEIKQTEQAQDLIKSISKFDEALFNISDGIGKGFSYSSIKWGLVDSKNVIEALTFTSQTQFVLDEKKETLRLRNDFKLDGDELIQYGWVKHHHVALSGNIATSSLFRTLAWIFVFKHYSIRDLAAFLEVYGMPIRVGTYRGNPTRKEKLTLLKAVRNLGHDAFGIKPDSMDIDFKEAGKGRSADFIGSIEYWDKAYSKAILGGTLTTQADGKSSTNALGTIHNDVRREVLEADAKQIAATITQDIVKPLELFNGLASGGRGATFEFVLIEEIDQVLTIEMLTKSVALGMKIPLDWVHQKMQIPVAKDDEEVISLQLNNEIVATKKGCGCCGTASLKKENKTLTASEIIADKLTAETQPMVDDWLESIELMLDKAESLDEFKEMILAAYSSLDNEAMAKKIAEGLTVSELAGFIDAGADSE